MTVAFFFTDLQTEIRQKGFRPEKLKMQNHHTFITPPPVFPAGASQVKWNRKNQYLLASSHDGDVRIWDKRVSDHTKHSSHQKHTASRV